ncbi:transglycosylase SLT domain protein [Caedimonas varicaedens]|uniref:Transglycosylase SLT domain protein n=1 Tax=Caedimonas varicaedens TaxID=1629334 RepID=A0A0K8MEW5_9PROT|nr:transglycosylase SLT domain protein [Caedimonas varicaedens]
MSKSVLFVKRGCKMACLLSLAFCSSSEASSPPKVSFALLEKIARQERVPVNLLKSVTYVESGFHPWTLNVQGRPHFFATRQEAEQHLDKIVKKGVTHIDIGCAQINWFWHGKKFKSPQDFLSPETSLRYAARLLRHHSQTTRSWMKAALLYHSGDKRRQSLYRQRLIHYLTKGHPA